MSPAQPQLGARFRAVNDVNIPMRADVRRLRAPADGNHSPSPDSNRFSNAFVETTPARVGASPGDKIGMELLLAAAQQDNSQTRDDGGSRHGPILDDGSTSLTDTIEATGDGNGSSSGSGSVSRGGGLENSDTSGGTAPTPYDNRNNSSDLVANSSEGGDAVGIPGHSGENTSLGMPAALPIGLLGNSGLRSGRTAPAPSYGCLQHDSESSTGPSLVLDLPWHGTMEPQGNQEQTAAPSASRDSGTLEIMSASGRAGQDNRPEVADEMPYTRYGSLGIALDFEQEGIALDFEQEGTIMGDLRFEEFLNYSPPATV